MNLDNSAEFTDRFERGKRGKEIKEIIKNIPSVISTSTQEAALEAIEEAMETIEKEGKIDIEPVRDTVEDITRDIINNKDACLKLLPLRVLDDHIFTHSINVAILSVYTGVRLNFPRARIEELGVGAMLHDVGKAWVPKDILMRKGRLTHDEFEKVKKHVEFGYKLLAADHKVTEVQKRIVYHHHERYNGSGYLKHLKGDEIGEAVSIVALANTYDALISDRVYRKGLPPYEAMKRIIISTSIDFHPKIAQIFMGTLSLYPPESIVRLNTGETAIVIKPNPDSLIRPTIRLLTDRDGDPLDMAKDIDLVSDSTRFIREVVKDVDSIH